LLGGHRRGHSRHRHAGLHFPHDVLDDLIDEFRVDGHCNFRLSGTALAAGDDFHEQLPVVSAIPLIFFVFLLVLVARRKFPAPKTAVVNPYAPSIAECILYRS
jgi:hypothetical protein